MAIRDRINDRGLVDPVLRQGIVGLTGASAYASYVATTSDDPVLTEAEWSAVDAGITTWSELDGKPAAFQPITGDGAAAAYTDPRLSDARVPLPHDPSTINRAAASTGDALIWDGSAWVPAPPVATDTLVIKTSLTAPADTAVGWFDPEANVLSFWDYVNLVWVGTPFVANTTPTVPALAYLNPALQPYLDPSGDNYLAAA